MKITKAVSMLAALAVAASAFAALPVTSFADAPLYSYDFTTRETVYSNDFTATESYNFDDNQKPAGWTIEDNDSVSGQKLKVTANNSSRAIFAPMLQSGKKYAITWDVSDLSTTSSATYQYITTLKIGGNTVNYPICYQPNGTWSNESGHTYVTSSAMNMIIFDTSTGKYDAYSRISEDADTIWKKSGTILATTDFKIEYYSWGSGFSIDNVAVTDITGWTISEQSKIKFSSNQLKISSAGSVFAGNQKADTVYNLNALDSNTTYKISWDGMSGGQWTGIELANKDKYAEYNIFQSDSKVFDPSTSLPSGTVPTMIELNTGTGDYTVKINGSSVKTGSLTANNQYQINFHTSGNNFYYTIDNFKVEKVVTPDLSAWTFTANTGATQSIKAEDSTLKIPAYNSAELPLDLDQNSIYDIEWDWLGTTAIANGYMSFGINSIGTIYHSIPGHLYYTGDHGDFYNKMHIRLSLNTQTGEWKVYVTDITNGTGTERDISIGGTATAPYTLQYNCWNNGGTHTIDNVTVTKTGVATDSVAAEAVVYSVNDDNSTYKIGTIINVNPSLYNNVVFKIGNTYYGGMISSVFNDPDNTTALEDIRGDAVIGIIFENAESTDVKVIFTNESLTYAPVD